MSSFNINIKFLHTFSHRCLMIRVCVVVIVHTEPDAEVIALSPRTLMATNRFVCEVCHKGFQREQNLQLHRRGHNLPWKLKQKDPKEARRRVYLCPEPTCVHHNPSRALGDLTQGSRSTTAASTARRR